MKTICNRTMWFIAWMFFIFMGCQSAFAADAIRFDSQDFPPFAYVKEGSKPYGMLVDLAEMILKKAGISFTVKGYPPKRLYRNLALGDTDATIGIKDVPEYEEKVIYSRFPLTHIDLRLYGLPDTPLPADNAGLKGKRVIVMRGYGYGGFLNYLEDPENRIIIDPSNSHESAFKKLAVKRGDFVLDYRRPAADSIKTLGYDNLNSRSVFKVGLFIVVSKHVQDGEKLITRMEDAFDQLKKEGKLDHLLSDETQADE